MCVFMFPLLFFCGKFEFQFFQLSTAERDCLVMLTL